uniref:Uncharacterized protein n=1 Tax=Anguilla anguilla TaxID=7936 RepID=A0A0E9WVR1_ANGAN
MSFQTRASQNHPVHSTGILMSASLCFTLIPAEAQLQSQKQRKEQKHQVDFSYWIFVLVILITSVTGIRSDIIIEYTSASVTDVRNCLERWHVICERSLNGPHSRNMRTVTFDKIVRTFPRTFQHSSFFSYLYLLIAVCLC